jgi:hypothetical protein
LAAFVGIDWAEANHEGCLQAAHAATREGLPLAHTPAASAVGGRTLRRRVNGPPVAICLARNTGPLVSAWRTSDLLGLCPLINPLTLARYRKACPPRRAKDDPTDAALPRARFLPPRDTLQPLQPQSPTMRALAQRVEHRRRVVGETVRLPPRLTSPLKNSVPQVRQGFQDKAPRMFCDCLGRWPPRKAAQLARRAMRARCVRDHHGRAAEVIAPRLHAIKTAPPWPPDEGVLAPHA